MWCKCASSSYSGDESLINRLYNINMNGSLNVNNGITSSSGQYISPSQYFCIEEEDSGSTDG